MDETGHHKGGRGKWGNCGVGCPIPPDDRESSVIVPDTKGRTEDTSRHRSLCQTSTSVDIISSVTLTFDPDYTLHSDVGLISSDT